MENLFVSYEIAKSLKEKGFNEPCFGYFDPLYKNLVIYNSGNNNLNSEMTWVSAPKYEQVTNWFDDNHKIRIDFTHQTSNGAYKYTIWKWNFDNNVGQWEKVLYLNSFTDKIERNNKALEEALKLI